jgi:hypothetical protein
MYLQNDSDWHVRSHMEPFFARLNGENKAMKIVGNWGSGHVPPSSDYQTKVLRAAVDLKGDWDRLPMMLHDCVWVSGQPSPAVN